MVTQEETNTTTQNGLPTLHETRAVSFKESYLDNLVEAEALLEVVGRMVSHYDEILINPKAYMGVSIMIEKISKLIDINDNMIPNDSADAHAQSAIKLDK